MDMNDVTREDVKDMSDDELVYWHSVFQKQAQTDAIRKQMLDFIEVRDAKNPHVIKIDNTVVG
ncbi:hypothetical protein LCGC14_1605450 [marine sediment metagenome]|uniref:Uncharacterized protein n=1 Tax=marine sediment metagenome TaxID=412755 RepID=A0A0F9IA77_9ZZZZ